MNKIKKIELAIANAELRISKLGWDVLNVPGLTSLNIRHLMNNLGSFSENYLELGPHKGGTFCSTIYENKNLKTITAIDCFQSDENNNDDKAEPQFRANSFRYKPIYTDQLTIVSDAFEADLKQIPHNVDLYLYDAGHTEDDQRRGLTYYYPVLSDEFIFCVDDYDWDEVNIGTQNGIKEVGCEVLFDIHLKSNKTREQGGHDNESFWNGFYVALLKK